MLSAHGARHLKTVPPVVPDTFFDRAAGPDNLSAAAIINAFLTRPALNRMINITTLGCGAEGPISLYTNIVNYRMGHSEAVENALLWLEHSRTRSKVHISPASALHPFGCVPVVFDPQEGIFERFQLSHSVVEFIGVKVNLLLGFESEHGEPRVR